MRLFNKLILKFCEIKIVEHKVERPSVYYNEKSEMYVDINREIKYYTIEYKLFNKWFTLKPKTNGNRYKFYSKNCIKKYLKEPRLKIIEKYKEHYIYIENIYYNYHDYFITDIKQIRIEQKYKLGKYLYDNLEEIKKFN